MAKKTEIRRVAIYTRVSTKDQNVERQSSSLRAHAEARGWEIVLEVEEKISGSAERKPEREKVLNMARKRKVDAVLVMSLDRWSRSTKDLVNTVDELRCLGVAFVAPGQVDMTTPAGRMMAGMLSLIAEFELELIRERVMSGLANARAKGRIGGRPRRHTEEGLALLQQGKSYSEVAQETGISMSTLVRARKKAREIELN